MSDWPPSYRCFLCPALGQRSSLWQHPHCVFSHDTLGDGWPQCCCQCFYSVLTWAYKRCILVGPSNTLGTYPGLYHLPPPGIRHVRHTFAVVLSCPVSTWSVSMYIFLWNTNTPIRVLQFEGFCSLHTRDSRFVFLNIYRTWKALT